MSSAWGDCAIEGCWHLGVNHEEAGPCTVTGCHCVAYLEQPGGAA